ncbi:beta-1,3-galactosyltransferase 1-like [Menidia menidia]
MASGGCCVARRHCLLGALLVAAAFFFFCYMNVLEMGSGWLPSDWIQSHSPKLFFSLGGANASQARLASPSAVTTTTAAGASQASAPPPYVSPGPYVVEYPHQYEFVLNQPQKCEGEPPFVVLVVQVAPANRAHRDTIRLTWGAEGRVRGKLLRTVFLLGRPTGPGAAGVQAQLEQEAARHADLVQSDFLDCYKNLTIKSMVMLEWLARHCPGAAYAMKVDSDMFLNPPNLVGLLLDAPRAGYMTGLVAHGGPVLRDPSNKWYLPEALFPRPVYPPYALGLGYVLSADLPPRLLEAARHVTAVYIEDVYLGLCMEHLGVAPSEPPAGGLFHVVPLGYDRCTFSRIVATTLTPDVDRMRLWEDFKRPEPYC